MTYIFHILLYTDIYVWWAQKKTSKTAMAMAAFGTWAASISWRSSSNPASSATCIVSGLNRATDPGSQAFSVLHHCTINFLGIHPKPKPTHTDPIWSLNIAEPPTFSSTESTESATWAWAAAWCCCAGTDWGNGSSFQTVLQLKRWLIKYRKMSQQANR